MKNKLTLDIDVEQVDQSPTAQLIYKTVSTQKITLWLQNTLEHLFSLSTAIGSQNYPELPNRLFLLFSDFYLSIIFIENEQIQALNYQYRKKNSPTNILSFPSAIPLDFYKTLPKEEKQYTLGDLVIALPVIQKEAEEQHKPLEHHLAHILVHGLLHLLSFDHEKPDEAEVMESLEIELLQYIGIPNPYESH